MDEGEIKNIEKKQKKTAIPADMREAWKEVCGRLKGIQGLDKIALVLEK